MTLTLRPIRPDQAEGLADALAPGFGGELDEARDLLRQTIDLLTSDPRPDPWGSYVAHDGDTPVGLCAFKTAPTPDGEVEIAYTTFPAYERRGHATAMAAALFAIAHEAHARLVVAHTLPEVNASTRALARNGFTLHGEVIDPEDGLVWRWERPAG